MKFVLLVCSFVVCACAQAQEFKEDELRAVARPFLEAVWELGKKAKEAPLNDSDIEKEIGKFLLDQPTNPEKGVQELYSFQRKQVLEFAKWLIGVASSAKDYALKPFLGIRLATKEDSEYFKDCLIWKITLSGKDAASTFTWILAFENSSVTDVNDTGQRNPKIFAIGKVSIKAPATAGARFNLS